jgi:hypothetical protein
MDKAGGKGLLAEVPEAFRFSSEDAEYEKAHPHRGYPSPSFNL